MSRRYVSIWLRHFKTDTYTRCYPHVKNIPFVLAAPDHGRLRVTAANLLAQSGAVQEAMVVADARAYIPGIEVIPEEEGRAEKSLQSLAEWFIRFSPVVAADPPDGLLIDATGCAHLWGGEKAYLTAMYKRLAAFGYHARPAMADTIGAAWAVARFGTKLIVPEGEQYTVLSLLPSQALRLSDDIVFLLQKLGLHSIKNFIDIAPASLHRRFGPELTHRLKQALGTAEEQLTPASVPVEYQERLPCLQTIVTAKGIEIALSALTETLCNKLKKDGKGLRRLVLYCYRVDGKILNIAIGTNRPTQHAAHLLKLFEPKIESIEPGLGIELFVLEAPLVEDCTIVQEELWQNNALAGSQELAELLDRISGKIPSARIERFLPDAHHWPENSYRAASFVYEKSNIPWPQSRPRPLHILATPSPIQVTAPIPDYPPMLFRHKSQLHRIARADGPERIAQEWWLQDGEHRDYYYVEDEEGKRYWIFRLGHYDPEKNNQWFLHGYFA